MITTGMGLIHKTSGNIDVVDGMIHALDKESGIAVTLYHLRDRNSYKTEEEIERDYYFVTE